MDLQREQLVALGKKYYSALTGEEDVKEDVLAELYLTSKILSQREASLKKEAFAEETKNEAVQVDETSSGPRLGCKVTAREDMPHFGRPDVLQRFPFNDSSHLEPSSFALPSLPLPGFLDIGKPLRKRLATTVYKDLCEGKAGLSVGDIPKGLSALGFEVEPELKKAFLGRSRENPLGLEQWHKVVARFVTREQIRLHHERDEVQAKITMARNSGSGSAAKARGDGADSFRNIQPTGHEEEAKSVISVKTTLTDPADYGYGNGLYSYYDSVAGVGASEKMLNRSNGNTTVEDESVVNIATSFLNGSVAREMYSVPQGWWDASEVPSRGDEAMKRLAVELGIDARRAAGFDSDSDADESAEAVLLDSLSLLNGGRNQGPPESFRLDDNLDGRTRSFGLKNKGPTQGDRRQARAEIHKDTARKIAKNREEGVKFDGWECKRGGWLIDYSSFEVESRDEQDLAGGASQLLSRETIERVTGRARGPVEAKPVATNVTGSSSGSNGSSGSSSSSGSSGSTKSLGTSSPVIFASGDTAPEGHNAGSGPRSSSSSTSSDGSIATSPSSITATVRTEDASATASVTGKGTATASISGTSMKDPSSSSHKEKIGEKRTKQGFFF